MMVTAREVAAWMPVLLLIAGALLIVMLAAPTQLTYLLGVVFEPRIFDKIQTVRSHGLTVDAAVELCAEQERINECELLVAHFDWCLGEFNGDDLRTKTPNTDR
jgi:hypothetical protein